MFCMGVELVSLRSIVGVCSENRVCAKIFGPKKDEETGEWNRLQNEKIYDLHS